MYNISFVSYNHSLCIPVSSIGVRAVSASAVNSTVVLNTVMLSNVRTETDLPPILLLLRISDY